MSPAWRVVAMPVRLGALVIALMLMAAVAFGQTADADRRRAFEQTMAERSRLVAQADTAWDREMAREKAGDCPDARTTYDENMCLTREVGITQNNLNAYVAAFRQIFASGDDADRSSGSTGTPQSRDEFSKEFDDVEAKWGSYKTAMCRAAFDESKGGTIAPSQSSRCELQLMRSHMRELGGVLGSTFHT